MPKQIEESEDQLKISNEPVKNMFDRIHKRYDFLNHLMSAGFDIAWRKKCCEAIKRGQIELSKESKNNAVILDICGGTGDFSIAYKKICGQPKISIVGDFSLNMLSEVAKKDSSLLSAQMDATKIPLADNSVDVVLNGFGMRNIPNLDAALAEAFRVLKVGGYFATLEFFKPVSGIPKVFYQRIAPIAIPFVGMLLSKRNAYRYLVLSILRFLTPKEYILRAKGAGFTMRCLKSFNGGLAHLVLFEKTFEKTEENLSKQT